METLPILLISTKSVWGGAQKYVFDLATNLPYDRFAVTVLAGGQGPLIASLRESNVAVTSIPTLARDIGFFAEIASAWAIFIAVRKLKPRIIHANGSKGATLGIIASKLASPSAKTIWSTHGVPILEDRPIVQRALILLSLWITRPFTTHVIAISKRDKETLMRYHITSPKRISLIPIALDIDALTFIEREEARRMIQEQSGKPCAGFIIGIIAEFTPNKGHQYFLEAFSQLIKRNKDATAVLIGWGKDESRIKHIVHDLKLQSHVTILPASSSDARFMKAFDVLTLTSVKEGLPYTLLEAGAASRAVVASSVGGIPDIISNETEGILVPPKDTAGLMNAYELLMNDESLRSALGESLCSRVKTEFGIAKEISHTAALYTSL